MHVALSGPRLPQLRMSLGVCRAGDGSHVKSGQQASGLHSRPTCLAGSNAVRWKLGAAPRLEGEEAAF